MDLLKTRMMVGNTGNNNLWVTIGKIYQNEGGLKTFFRGATPRLMHKIPANAIFFLFYEYFRSLFGIKMTKS